MPLQCVVRELHLRQVDGFTFPAKLKEREEPFVKDGSLLDARAAVVEHLRKERVEPDVRPHVSLEEYERIEFGLGILASLHVTSVVCSPERLLGRAEPRLESVHNRLDGSNQISLFSIRIQFDYDDALDLVVVVMPSGIELRPQVVDEVRIGRRRQLRRRVVGLEGCQDFTRIIYEVEDVGRVLARVSPVQP